MHDALRVRVIERERRRLEKNHGFIKRERRALVVLSRRDVDRERAALEPLEDHVRNFEAARRRERAARNASHDVETALRELVRNLRLVTKAPCERAERMRRRGSHLEALHKRRARRGRGALRDRRSRTRLHRRSGVDAHVVHDGPNEAEHVTPASDGPSSIVLAASKDCDGHSIERRRDAVHFAEPHDDAVACVELHWTTREAIDEERVLADSGADARSRSSTSLARFVRELLAPTARPTAIVSSTIARINAAAFSCCTSRAGFNVNACTTPALFNASLRHDALKEIVAEESA